MLGLNLGEVVLSILCAYAILLFGTLCICFFNSEIVHDLDILRLHKPLKDPWKHDTYKRFRSLPLRFCVRI